MLRDIAGMYLDGFRAMRIGRVLWLIILIKLLVLFGVVRPFFMPDILAERYATDVERAEHVYEVLAAGR